MSVRRKGACVASAAAVVAAVAGPASASAATLVTDRACYDSVNGAMITVGGQGYTPGDTIDLQGDGIFTSVGVAANGEFVTQVPVPTLPFIAPGVKGNAITASSESSGASLATALFDVANFAVQSKPNSGPPSKTVHYRFSGFIGGKPIYGHYILHHRVRVTHRYGMAKGPCGILKAKAKLYPGRHPAYGDYKIQFDQSKRYRKKNVPRLDVKFTIFRKLRF